MTSPAIPNSPKTPAEPGASVQAPKGRAFSGLVATALLLTLAPLAFLVAGANLPALLSGIAAVVVSSVAVATRSRPRWLAIVLLVVSAGGPILLFPLTILVLVAVMSGYY